MKTNAAPSGVFAPVATIFNNDDELDLAAFRANLDWYAGSALDGVVLLGSNGEFATLDADERMRVIEAGAAAIGGRKIVMAGTGAESTRETIRQTRRAAELGVDYALVVTPHYYRTRYDHAAYLAHYQAVADASPIPILIYIMTTYTGVDLTTNLVAELSTHPNIAGIKDSSGNAPKAGEMIERAAPGFAVLAGSASFLYPALCLGATGGILALANVAPDACKEIEQRFLAGDHEQARLLQLKMLAPNAAVTSRFGIAGLKVALETVGLNGGKVRPPQLPLNERDAAEVSRILSEAGIERVERAVAAV